MHMSIEAKQMLLANKHSTLNNYIVPGLASHLIGGTVRMFTMEREPEEFITPHSHRFDFACLVLAGSVTNTIYTATSSDDPRADLFTVSKLRYTGKPGHHEQEVVAQNMPMLIEKTCYGVGDWYSMTADQYHSIRFSKGACVLFFEQPQSKEHSFILEPSVNGSHVPTFKTEDWMFTPV